MKIKKIQKTEESKHKGQKKKQLLKPGKDLQEVNQRIDLLIEVLKERGIIKDGN